MNTCTLCNEIVRENSETPFQEIVGKQCLERILRVSENFVVLPAIGQIIEGYLLIVTKKHYISMGELPENHLVELNALMQEISAVLKKIYQSRAIFFEHGSVTCIGEGGSCIDHAHIHAVPIEVDLIPKIPPFYEVKKIESLGCLKEQVKKRIPYCFYQSVNNEKYVFDGTVVPSQFFRRLIAHEVESPDIWNWREFPEKHKLIAAVEKLSNWETIKSGLF